MTMTSNPIDLIIQFALLQAGEEDDLFDRQLGPIHLIKYVYLADLHYARRHEGDSFTGIDWRFYNFGPWSAEVYERIPSALKIIGAEENRFPSDYEERKDWIRWHIRDKDRLERIRRELPAEITLALRRDVHKFKKDTPELLQHVYSTKPMLNAAPNELLDFSLAIDDTSVVTADAFSPRFAALSTNKKKRFKERMAALRDKHVERVRNQPEKPLTAAAGPYDEVFTEGVAWLDGLTDAPQLGSELEVEFDDSVWKSQTRKGYDVS